MKYLWLMNCERGVSFGSGKMVSEPAAVDPENTRFPPLTDTENLFHRAFSKNTEGESSLIFHALSARKIGEGLITP